jgi:hypothetical protein
LIAAKQTGREKDVTFMMIKGDIGICLGTLIGSNVGAVLNKRFPLHSRFLSGEIMKNRKTSILKNSKNELAEIVTENRLLDARVFVLVKTLTPEEAVGVPGRRDFPIILGKERVVEAEVLGAKAHAFTDSPGEFMGSLKKVLSLPLTSRSSSPARGLKGPMISRSLPPTLTYANIGLIVLFALGMKS